MKEVDVLFFNGPILVGKPSLGKVIDNAYLLVKDGKILEVAAMPSAGVAEFAAKEKINLDGKLLIPGLINTHTHSAMTIFRGLADDLPLMEWLENYIFPIEKDLTHDWVYWGTQLACLEMIRSGTTTFCDMYLFAQAVAESADCAGMRAIIGEAVYDFPSPNYGACENGFSYYDKLLARWSDHDLISIAVTPHAPYTCSPELLKKYHAYARKNNLIFNIHLAETQHEVAIIKERYGLSPVKHLEKLGLLDEKFLADHLVWATSEELDILAKHQVRVSHNPESNMKLGSGIAPVAEMLEKGICVGLGTDGSASNNNLDLFSEMDSAAKLQKVANHNTTLLSAAEVINMATLDGAKCLGLEKITGSIEVGKAADLVMIDFSAPHLQPVYNYPSHLTFCVQGSDVQSVMINGKWVLKDQQFMTLNQEEIYAHIKEISDSIKKKIL